MEPVRLMPIRLVVVDGHELVRIGLRVVIDGEEDIELVGDYENAESALGALEGLRPHVVLMCVDMRGMDGVHACRHIRSRLPDVKVVMLTSHSDEETVVASIMAGASGYLLNNTSVVELLRAVRAVAGGESLLDPAITWSVLDRLKALTTTEGTLTLPATADGVSQLSKRESQVFSLVVDGYTNKDIAEQLVISENTARNHVSRILHKLGLNSRSQAAAFGLQRATTAD